jgi:hypothetical protein
VYRLIRFLAGVAMLAALLCFPPRLDATSVLSPGFNELVREADLIFTGRATHQRSEWRRIDGRRSIVTLVTFQVLGVHKGRAGGSVQLEFLGGRIGDATLRVDGMPEFHIGERALLFAEANGVNASPLVGFHHGKFNVLTDESIAQHDGTPVADIAEIGRPRPRRAAGSRPITHEAFTRHIRQATQQRN